MTAVGTDPNERELRKFRIKVCKKALDVYYGMQKAIFGTEEEGK
jgi:hypothetical protein